MAYHPFRHLGLKFLALSLATLLWLTVSGERIVERGMRVPLGFENIPADLEIVGDPPNAVDVRVRGSWGVLSMLAPGDITAVLDLRSARSGSRLFHLGPSQVRAPYGADITQVSPATVSLVLERSASRAVPVVPAVEGQPAVGFEVESVTTEPSTVEVVGPESEIGQLTAATTEPVSIDGARDSVRDQVTVGVASSMLRLSIPVTATVIVHIVPVMVHRTLKGVGVQVRNLAENRRATVLPRAIAVTIRGPEAQETTALGEALTASVDVAGLGAGRYNLPVSAEPPDGWDVVAVEPATIQVRIR